MAQMVESNRNQVVEYCKTWERKVEVNTELVQECNRHNEVKGYNGMGIFWRFSTGIRASPWTPVCSNAPGLIYAGWAAAKSLSNRINGKDKMVWESV